MLRLSETYESTYMYNHERQFVSPFICLDPNMPVPTRTISLPAFNAASKSLDIPILNKSLPSFPQSAFPVSDSNNGCNTSLVAFKVSKSSFSEAVDCDWASDPMVIRPCKCSLGHCEIMCRASWASSDSPGDGDDDFKGGRPDLTSSPEVFTWRRMFSGGSWSIVRDFSRVLFRASAAFVDVRVCIA